jgi:hypothetical protein
MTAIEYGLWMMNDGSIMIGDNHWDGERLASLLLIRKK